jgi:hypothetical protein
MSGSAFELLYETTVYAKGLRSLARCLWIIFAGWVLLVPATIAMFGLSFAERQKWEVPGEAQINMLWPWLAIVGALLNLYGKYSCFELRQPLEFGRPLPGARSLSIAFYSDMAAALLRLLGRGAMRAQFRWFAFPLHILGQIMFLLFLRKIADVVDRRGIRWLLDVTLAALVLSVACGGIAVFLLAYRIKGPFLLLGCGLASATFLVITTVGYMLALAQLARALGHFANYLNETAFDDDDDDVDSP